jgi:integrase
VCDRNWGKMAALITLAFHTGLRKANLLNLRWRDVDLGNGTATVIKTKNGKPIVAALSGAAVKALMALPGKKDPDGYVFANNQGKPFHITTLWAKITTHAGLAGKNFHQLRHGCGSMLATAGVGQAQIMSVMGSDGIGSLHAL